MINDDHYQDVDVDPRQAIANLMGNLSRFSQPRNDDIEVIDLDDPRGQIKPTTWHK